MQKIINSPGQYIQGEGELSNLASHYSALGKTGAYIIVDAFILSIYKEQIISSFKKNNISCTVESFKGECSEEEIERHSKLLNEAGNDVVIGIGGGKTLDTTKAVSFYNNIPIMVVPTTASSDAPSSKLSVIYTPEGEFKKYLFLSANPDMVIMDTDVIVNAPARLLSAGIGDALATYYEANACKEANALSIAGAHISLTAMALATLCRDTLLSDGYKAILAVREKVCTKSVENIIEANTYLSGVGFESGGLAAAHAIHNGLTVLKECHHMLHGEKVAFGTLVQLVMENRPIEEITSIMNFCTSVGLPTTLSALGLENISKDQILKVANAATVESETIHNMPFQVTSNDVYAAILITDKLGTQLTQSNY